MKVKNPILVTYGDTRFDISNITIIREKISIKCEEQIVRVGERFIINDASISLYRLRVNRCIYEVDIDFFPWENILKEGSEIFQ